MKILTAVLLAAGLASTARADIVAIYEMTNNSSIPTVFDGVTGTAFSVSPTLTLGVANLNLFSTSVNNSTNTPALAVTNGQYFQFTITPPAGKKLHYEAIAFEASKQTNNNLRGWVVRTSVDSFGADVDTQAVIAPTPAFADFKVDLSGPAYTNVSAPVTFRIYTYASAQLEFLDYDNIQIFATVDEAPRVTVTSIDPTDKRVTLRGTATDDTGVANVNVNGKNAAGTTSWLAKVRLKPRVTRIRIAATDNGGSTSAEKTIRLRRARS